MPHQAEAEKSKAREEEFAAAHAELFCKVCNKQYTKATEMEVHLSSYDHGHKKVRMLVGRWKPVYEFMNRPMRLI